MTNQNAYHTAASYRQLVTLNDQSELAKVWQQAFVQQPSVWEKIGLSETLDFFFELDDKRKIPLGSIGMQRLAPGIARLGIMGKMVAYFSLGARVMAGRKGTEEVTFYCLHNETHKQSFLASIADRIVLSMLAPPLNWRRKIVVGKIRQELLNAVKCGTSQMTLLDIGCGGGFDGLELLLGVRRLRAALQGKHVVADLKIIDVDIDTHWLGNNEILTAALVPDLAPDVVIRHNLSIFDYFVSKDAAQDIGQPGKLVVSCNGFADFLPPEEMRKLLQYIQDATRYIPQEVTIIVPMAVKNYVQAVSSRLVGFGYTTWETVTLRKLVEEIFVGYAISYEEQHSQGVFVLERRT